MERELGRYSFNNSSADSNGSPRRNVPNDHTRDYSLDYKGGDTDTADSNDFFPRSPAPSTHDLSKHFRDFSMQGIESSMDSVEMPRGAKEMGTPELDSRDFDRPAYSIRNKPIVLDQDLSTQMHTESSHGRSASLSDFGDMNKRFPTAEKFGKSNLKTDLNADLDRDFKSASTPRLKSSDMPERPRSTFLDRYAKPSPPFQRPQNPVAKMMENDSAKKTGASTLPRSFKDSTQLLNDLGISSLPERHQNRDNPARHQSFRLPDMTGIHSLIDTPPRLSGQKRSPLHHIPLESVPVPQNEKDIISGLRTLQERVSSLTTENNQQKTRVRELEAELHRQKSLFNSERAKRDERENQLFRRSSRDSGFGSVEDSDEAMERQKAYHAKDRMKFENQLAALKSKITLLEAQLDSEREKTKNLQEERDEAIRGMANALNESEGIKSENKALKLEIATLKKQYRNNVGLSQSQGTATAKERIKERVETERKKDKSRRKSKQESEGEGDRAFIQPDEIEELRREIKALKDAKAKVHNTDPKVSILKAESGRTLDQNTRDAHGHVQTIRIQLENGKERKDTTGQRSKHRRIKRVIVESDESSHESSNSDLEEEAISGSSDDEHQEFLKKARKNIPIEPWLAPPGQAKGSVSSEIQNIINGLARHNSASCTVCSRKRRLQGKKEPFSRRPLQEVHLNDSPESLNEGVSIRPSVPPKQALNSVLSQLKDEFHHLQLQYRTLTKQYESLDPGYGKRRRKAIAEKLRDILEEFEAKADQIYALYDVVEGARQDGMGQRGWLEL